MLPEPSKHVTNLTRRSRRKETQAVLGAILGCCARKPVLISPEKPFRKRRYTRHCPILGLGTCSQIKANTYTAVATKKIRSGIKKKRGKETPSRWSSFRLLCGCFVGGGSRPGLVWLVGLIASVSIVRLLVRSARPRACTAVQLLGPAKARVEIEA